MTTSHATSFPSTKDPHRPRHLGTRCCCSRIGNGMGTGPLRAGRSLKARDDGLSRQECHWRCSGQANQELLEASEHTFHSSSGQNTLAERITQKRLPTVSKQSLTTIFPVDASVLQPRLRPKPFKTRSVKQIGRRNEKVSASGCPSSARQWVARPRNKMLGSNFETPAGRGTREHAASGTQTLDAIKRPKTHEEDQL